MTVNVGILIQTTTSSIDCVSRLGYLVLHATMTALKDGNASDNKGPMILSVLWALTGLTSVLVIARMYIRTSLLHNLGSDDWLITASLVCMCHARDTTANSSR